MAAKKISLRELRNHVKRLDQLVTDAWFNTHVPAQISFADVRELAAAITALLAEDTTSPHAASGTKSPSAAADNDKADAQKRADYQRTAADKMPVDFSAVLGVGHIRRG